MIPESNNLINVFDANYSGYVRSYYASYNRGVRPAVYLLSNVKLLKGTGSLSNSFEFEL